MRDFAILHSLAEATLIAGLEVAPVDSPRLTEVHSQPEHQDRRHPTNTAGYDLSLDHRTPL